ncbi:hypothetical protein DTL21_13355 [Bremerella cremea]|uniref:Cytochrome c domain-containing protein n=2 Tax=Pirellulales TaxID=2691354 RepID=A0A2S8FR16_9BACT|nr:hypothetical protein C5Y83_13350 [Blastopirellula marina]RCS46996.1 hypothetical protein DTL21_13355 [Bremerella cremea]
MKTVRTRSLFMGTALIPVSERRLGSRGSQLCSVSEDPPNSVVFPVIGEGKLESTMRICQAPEFGGRYQAGGLVLAVLVGAIIGCTSEPPQFDLNEVALRKTEITQDASLSLEYQIDPIAKILSENFGTPDDPKVPEFDYEELFPDLYEDPESLDEDEKAKLEVEQSSIKDLLKIDMLKMAAGPYGSEEDGSPRGLYRQHCVHCHGINGDGAGPTAAFLNPYPRDFRMGKFKWKSTKTGVPPTHDDLKRIIMNGAPGTAMPSFKLLPEEEVEALVQYVKYLTIRGESERNLLMEFSQLDAAVAKPAEKRNEEEKEYIKEMSPEELAEAKEDLKAEVEELTEYARMDFILPVYEKWRDAEPTEVPARPDWDLDESIAAGKVLFFGKGGCATCHGQSGLGDGQTAEMFYDDWTEDFFDPKAPDNLEEFLALGALPPRKLDPRNLRLGNFRGGRRPVDVYWRIKNGIEGAKMPAAAYDLQDEDVWHLVDFVLKGLPYDSLSQPSLHEQENIRLRN